MSNEVLIAIVTAISSVCAAYLTARYSNKKISRSNEDDDDDHDCLKELAKAHTLQTDLLVRLGKAWNKIEALEAQIELLQGIQNGKRTHDY